MPAIFHIKEVDNSFEGAVQYVVDAQPGDDVVWHCEKVDASFDGAIFHVKKAPAGYDGPVWRIVSVSPGGEVVVVGPDGSPLSLPDAIANSLEYLKAFGGTEQRNLPSGYTQVEYIESTGTQYIDTGVVPKTTLSVKIKYNILQLTAQNNIAIFGSLVDAVGLFSGVAGSSQYYINKGSGSLPNIPFALNTIREEEYINNTMIRDGVTYTTNPIVENNISITLFSRNLDGTAERIGTLRIYYFTLYDNGVLIQNLVPCKRNSDNVVGMYDTVSGTFLTNAGTGAFAAGGEAVPTPDTPMDIVSNNGVLKARHQSGLPLGYTLLDYIESDGHQYIDLGLPLDNNSKVRIRFKSENTTQTQALFGARAAPSGTDRKAFVLWENVSSRMRFDFQSETLNATKGISTSDWNEIVKDGVHNTLNGVAQTDNTASTFATDYSAYLFNVNTAGVAGSGMVGSVSVCQVWQGGDTLSINAIPCRRNSDNVIGMYDIVNGVFYTNAGTGTFTAGTTVSDPVEIYTDGTVETINAHGKNLFDGQWQQGVYSTSTGEYTPDISNRICNVNMIQIKPSTTYTVSCPDYALASGMRWLFYDENKNFISATVSGATTITTPSNAKYINFYIANNLTTETAPDLQLEQGSTATTYEEYFNGGTATAEMLLKVGDYEDVQEILSGAVTKNIGIKVLDGTENWRKSNSNAFYLSDVIIDYSKTSFIPFCTHFNGQISTESGSSQVLDLCACFYIGQQYKEFYIRYNAITSAEQFKSFLADQYANGTPVVIIYPLATPTTESVAGQTMQVQAGDNTLEITQASLSNLELEAKYKKSA